MQILMKSRNFLVFYFKVLNVRCKTDLFNVQRIIMLKLVHFFKGPIYLDELMVLTISTTI